MQKVLIAGGSDGLGKALAQDLSKDYQVIILANDAEKTEQVSKEIGCDFVIADVTNPDQIKAAVESVIEKYSEINCLINSAGIWIQGKLEENDPDRIKKTIDVNTTGTILMTAAVLPHMKSRKNGRIININSQAGFSTKVERSVYNASKWAITGFTKTMSDELSGTGVTITGFYPGSMKTSFFSKANIEKDISQYMELPDVVRALRFVIETPDSLSIPEFGIKPAFY